jgi:hypothetical protein
MVGLLVAVGCRVLVATVFVLTACWKVANRNDFERSFRRLAPRSVESLASLAVWIVSAVEIAIAVVILAGAKIATLSVAGPLAGCALLSAFTVALALGEKGSCGCWFTPPSAGRGLKLLPIIRNLTLFVTLLLAAILSPHGADGLGFAAVLSPIVTGMILAALLIEAPQILAAITFRPPTTRLGGAR